MRDNYAKKMPVPAPPLSEPDAGLPTSGVTGGDGAAGSSSSSAASATGSSSSTGRSREHRKSTTNMVMAYDTVFPIYQMQWSQQGMLCMGHSRGFDLFAV